MRVFYFIIVFIFNILNGFSQLRLEYVDSKAFPLATGQSRAVYALSRTPFVSGESTFQVWDASRRLVVTYDWKTQIRLRTSEAASPSPPASPDSLLFDPYRLLYYRFAADSLRSLTVLDAQKKPLTTLSLSPDHAPHLCFIRPEGLAFQGYPNDSLFPPHLGITVFDLQQADPFYRNDGFGEKARQSATRPYRDMGPYLRQATGSSATRLAVLVAPELGFHGSLSHWLSREAMSATAQSAAFFLMYGPRSPEILSVNGAIARIDVRADTTAGYFYKGKPVITCPHLILLHGEAVTHVVRLRTLTDLAQLPLLLSAFQGLAPGGVLDFSRVAQ